MSEFRCGEIWVSPQGVQWKVWATSNPWHPDATAYARLKKMHGMGRRIEMPAAATKGWTCTWSPRRDDDWVPIRTRPEPGFFASLLGMVRP